MPVGWEARCRKCGQLFNPNDWEGPEPPATVLHYWNQEKDEECGGVGDVLGSYGWTATPIEPTPCPGEGLTRLTFEFMAAMLEAHVESVILGAGGTPEQVREMLRYLADANDPIEQADAPRNEPRSHALMRDAVARSVLEDPHFCAYSDGHDVTAGTPRRTQPHRKD